MFFYAVVLAATEPTVGGMLATNLPRWVNVKLSWGMEVLQECYTENFGGKAGIETGNGHFDK